MKISNRRLKKGQSIVEYAFILVLVVLVLVLILSVTGKSIGNIFCSVLNGLTQGGSGSCSYITDEFASLDNWVKIWGAGTQTLANGQLVMKSDARILDKTPVPDDFRVIVDKATLLTGNGYGLMFRMSQSGTNYSGYAFQVDPGYGNKFIFRRYDQNGVELGAPLAVGSPPANFNWNAPHKVEVVVKGNTFQGYVDGMLIVTASDGTYPSGQVGLRTWDSTEAHFDNLVVTPP